LILTYKSVNMPKS